MSKLSNVQEIGTGVIGAGSVQYAVGLYDFAVDGGAIGAITLRGDKIPSGAIEVDALFEVDTVLASAGAATVSLDTEAVADVNADVVITGTPWSTTGPKRADVLTATAAPVKTTAERSLAITVTTAALTAGKFKVYVAYVVLAD